MSIKEISNKTDEYDTSKLELEISGSNINYAFINSLRKMCINQVPIYAFHASTINITKNTSIYDNTYMKERLSQLPIRHLNHNINILPLKYYKNINFGSNYVKHPDDKYQIEYYVKIKNDGPENILNVTTNDLIMTINNEVVSNKEKNPILLIQLKIGEEFECSMKGVLGIGELESIFNSAHSYYKEIDPNKYLLTVITSGQLTNYDILARSCLILIEKLKVIKEGVNNEQYNKLITEENSVILELINEDHTCGGIINYILQNKKNVIYSGVTKQNFMQKNILLKIKTDKTTTPIKALVEAIDDCINDIVTFSKEIDKRSKSK
jgi:DNA-directed RNA polymerase subunit L